MKKIIVLIPFIILSTALGFSLNISAPNEVNYLDEFHILLTINPENKTVFDLVIILPEKWEVENWSSNAENVFAEFREVEYIGEKKHAFRWRFENVKGKIFLNYSTKALSVGKIPIVTIWTYPVSFGMETNYVSVKTVCGNGICEPTESILNCPIDCFQIPSYILLLILIIATVILILGIAYREYKKKRRKRRKKR